MWSTLELIWSYTNKTAANSLSNNGFQDIFIQINILLNLNLD